MERDEMYLSCENITYSFRLSIDAESFIEFDLKLMSMRWKSKSEEEMDNISQPSVSLDSTESLLSICRQQQQQQPPLPPPNNVVDSTLSNHMMTAKQNRSFENSCLCFILMRLVKRARSLKLLKRSVWKKAAGKAVSKERGRGNNKVFACIESENSIEDAVVYCRNSSLRTLMHNEMSNIS